MERGECNLLRASPIRTRLSKEYFRRSEATQRVVEMAFPPTLAEQIRRAPRGSGQAPINRGKQVDLPARTRSGLAFWTASSKSTYPQNAQRAGILDSLVRRRKRRMSKADLRSKGSHILKSDQNLISILVPMTVASRMAASAPGWTTC